jgi:hypothetical protein
MCGDHAVEEGGKERLAHTKAMTHEVRRSPGPGTLSRERHHEWIRKAEETWEGYLMKRKSGTGSRSSTDGGMSHRVC